MSCLICEIINEEKPSFKIFENENFVAFLDIKPLFVGHCLISPKQHIQTLYELPSSLGNEWLTTIQRLGNAIKKAMGAEGTFIAINNTVSQSIPHLHVHIVPRKKGDGLKGFFWPRNQYKNEEHLIEIQKKIKDCL